MLMLSRINRAIIRVESPDELYQEACRIAVDSGLFQFAWVGLVDRNVGTMRFMYCAGEQHCPATVLTAESSLAESVRRQGSLVIYSDPRTFPPTHDRDEFFHSGYCGLAVLPLREDGNTIGALSLYTCQEGCFDKTVVNLLAEVMDDISFCLQHLWNEQRRLANEAKLHYLAFYDAQTGMPNRVLLEERLPLLAARAQQRGTLLSLLDIRLQRFDNIVQIHGRRVVEELLRILALRMERLRGADGLLAQLAHDEFMLATVDMVQAQDIVPLVQALTQVFEQAVSINDKDVFVHAAIGAALYPLHEPDLAYLMRRARAAARRSEEEGRFQVYQAAHDYNLERQVEMEAELHRALEREEFLMYYQPKVDLRNGELTGAEALIRWQHPDRGFIAPAEFIPQAEESGLILPLGAWVIGAVCQQLRRWIDAGLPVLPAAVNVSARQFRQANLAAMLREALLVNRLDPKLIELEITESSLMENLESAAMTLRELKEIGVKLTLDDFGTGYSSLSYLQRFPVDYVKIDQAFVRDATVNPGDAAICRSIIELAHAFQLRVIGEGVETEGQMNFLRRHHCDELQGYYFSKPIPGDDYEQMLKRAHVFAVSGPVAVSNQTLLVVDDETNILSAVRRLCHREHFRVLTASSGREGLELLAKHEVQVVLSDQRMPHMSGAEFLARVRAMYPETIRIVLSGYADLATIIDAVNRGTIFKFLTKPWDDDFLLMQLREAFLYHQARAEERLSREAGSA